MTDWTERQIRNGTLDQIIAIVTEEATTSQATRIGKQIGYAIAKDVMADELPPEWTGLSDQDGDIATAAGIMPNTPEWDEMEAAAKHTYMFFTIRVAGPTAT